MGRRKQLRELLGIFKDKASLIKATLSTNRSTSSIQVAVLRTTTHRSSSPPPEHRIASVLSLGNESRLISSACIEAIMDRLHNSGSVYVSLKSLIMLHNIVTRGSFILKDQLSVYPSAGGYNFLNLTRFFDKTDVETWELSAWARWFASVLEHNLMSSRVLGFYFCSSSSTNNFKDSENLRSLMNSDLFGEIDVLAGMVEEICRAPESSYNYQRNNLVYEVMRLVGEDYRSTRNHIANRLGEFGDRMDGLNSGELAELKCCLNRLEECKERLMGLFVNRKKDDAFWDLISQTEMKVLKVNEERERGVLVRMERKEQAAESTRFGKRIVGPTQLLRLLPLAIWR